LAKAGIIISSIVMGLLVLLVILVYVFTYLGMMDPSYLYYLYY
jgi:hypothetical protein